MLASYWMRYLSFYPSNVTDSAAGRRIFRQLCDVLDTEKIKNHAAVHTHDPLYIYATIGGLRADEIRAESVAAMAGVAKGRARDVLVFLASRPSI